MLVKWFPILVGFPAGSENLDKPVDLGRPDPDLAERISREHPGDLPGYSFGGSGAHLSRDRACSPSMRRAEDLCHVRGGSCVQLGQGRAGMRQDCNHKECHGNLLGGSGPQPPQARAVKCNHGEYPDHRALHDDHGLCPDPRALHSTHGVCHGDRASLASNPHHGDPRRSCLEPGMVAVGSSILGIRGRHRRVQS